MIIRFVFAIFFALHFGGPLASVQATPLAFPTAEGFGKFAKGGRGGRVIPVTTLNCSGPGSLVEALEASGPRTIVFRVGGIINCSNHQPLYVKNPYLTIAGQTAPGDGILLKGMTLAFDTQHVIIRYMRIRLGDEFQGSPESTGSLAIIGTSSDVIVDHVSVSWGSDDTLLLWDSATNITIQWTIVSEGIDCGKKSTCHGKGMLQGSSPINKVSMHHNLFANTSDRNPLLGAGLIDLINNVHHNVGGNSTHLFAYHAPLQANIVGNYFSKGPLSQPWQPIRLIGQLQSLKLPGSSAYIKSNIDPVHRPTDILPELDTVVFTDGPPHWPISTNRISTMTYPSETDALQAYEAVLNNAGDNRRLNENGSFSGRRGAIDTRIVNEVRTGKGAMVGYSQNEVGGYSGLSNGPPYADKDQDGMADIWEGRNGLSMADPTDGSKDTDGDGYTNLEEFLNGTTPETGTNDFTPPDPPQKVEVTLQ